METKNKLSISVLWVYYPQNRKNQSNTSQRGAITMAFQQWKK